MSTTEITSKIESLKELEALIEEAQSEADTTISVGERISTNTFLSLLTSRTEAPKIRFTSVGNVPIVLLQNYTNTICSIPLVDVKNVVMRSDTTEFSRKDLKVYFSCNQHDYSLNAILDN